MPVPVSNVGFNNIEAEFGGTAPTAFDEYYRGGSNVPLEQPKSIYWPTQISTSGEISVGMFRGLSKAAVYDLDGSTLSGWNLHPQDTSGGVQNWTQVFLNGGNPGAYIHTRADEWRRNWMWRNVSLSQYNNFNLSFHSWIQNGNRCLPFVQLGAVNGNGTGFALYFDRVATCSWTSYGAAHTGTTTVVSHSSIVQTWVIYEFFGSRLSPSSFSVQFNVRNFNTNALIATSTVTLTSGVSGDEWSFRYTGDVSGNGEHQKLDNMKLVLY